MDRELDAAEQTVLRAHRQSAPRSLRKRGSAGFEREREDPLPDWHCGQDAAFDVPNGIAHPALGKA
jgi:hypothetical protein